MAVPGTVYHDSGRIEKISGEYVIKKRWLRDLLSRFVHAG